MNIQPINLINFTPTFKSLHAERDFEDIDTEETFAQQYGDDVREALRNRIYERAGIIIPEYTPEDAKTIEDAKINNFGRLPNNSYRGASLANRPKCVELLANSGIHTVIDLDGSAIYESNCKKNNIEYHFIDLRNGFWTNPMFRSHDVIMEKYGEQISKFGFEKKDYDEYMASYKDTIKKDCREFMDKFIEISDIMSRGNLYVGCELGDYRTSNFLALQYYFNPSWTGPKIKTEPYIFEFCQNMYLNLTPEDKTALGFTEKYDKKLRQELKLD